METRIAKINHPGRLLEKELKAREWSQKMLAELIGKSPVEINYIIKGQREINSDLAMRFSIALGTSAELWLGLQNQHNLYLIQTEKSKKPIFAKIRKNVKALEKEAVLA